MSIFTIFILKGLIFAAHGCYIKIAFLLLPFMGQAKIKDYAYYHTLKMWRLLNIFGSYKGW